MKRTCPRSPLRSGTRSSSTSFPRSTKRWKSPSPPRGVPRDPRWLSRKQPVTLRGLQPTARLPPRGGGIPWILCRLWITLAPPIEPRDHMTNSSNIGSSTGPSAVTGAPFIVQQVEKFTVIEFRNPSLMDPIELEQIGQSLYRLVDAEDRRRLVLDFEKVQYLSSQA